MKTHSTNYFNTLIEIAEDSPRLEAENPVQKGDSKTVALLQFEMLKNQPYRYDSDDVFFEVFAQRKDIIEAEKPEERKKFFSKGQPCFRASPLTKQYGFGIHSDVNGKVALIPAESKEYIKLLNDEGVKKVKAMRSKRK